MLSLSAWQQLSGSHARQLHCLVSMLAPGFGGGWKKPLHGWGCGCGSAPHARVARVSSALPMAKAGARTERVSGDRNARAMLRTGADDTRLPAPALGVVCHASEKNRR